VGLHDLYDRFDRFQQQHRWLGFPLAVRQKYADDQGGYLAATVAYYGFFSIFPLLLVFTTVLGFVLRGHPHLQSQIVNSALGQFPVIGHELTTRSLKGSTLALVIGVATALWAGMGAVLAAQNAMNQLWGVPFKRRPDFLSARLRSLLLLVVLGSGALAATALAGVGTIGVRYGIGWKIASIVLSTLLDFAVFWVALRVLTARDVSWSNLRGGAVAAAIGYEGLQLLGGYYIGHVLKNASNTYGTFALVIGLLSFIYLAAHITLLAAEGSVVASHRLWPRSFSLVFEQPATHADRAALTQRGKVEERRQDEQVDVQVPVGEESGPVEEKR
jgi:membrane protein